jgi:putative uncharacterized protein (fragment)
MKELFKGISNFFTDLSGLLRPLIFQIQYQHFKCEMTKNTENETICILGNGPSLEKFNQDVPEGKKKDCCTVNFSGNTELFFLIKPSLYVLSDVAFYQDSQREDVQKLWQNLKKIDWKIRILVPYTFPLWFKIMLEENHNISVQRFCQVNWDVKLPLFKRFRLYLYSKGLLAPRNQNVMIPAIYSAILSGYRRIELYGVEHSWLPNTYVDENNVVMQKDVHYYGTTFRPWEHADGSSMKMYEFLIMMYHTFRSYWLLRELVDYCGDVQVINKTPNSYIDAFVRE